MSGPVIVDTNVVSFMYRNDTRAVPYEELILRSAPHLSVVSIGELLFGAYRASWSARRTAELMNVARTYTVLDISSPVAEVWAAIRSRASSLGQQLPEADAWIGATAVVLDYPVVTHNPRDFQSIAGLEVLTYA